MPRQNWKARPEFYLPVTAENLEPLLYECWLSSVFAYLAGSVGFVMDGAGVV
jgi:hypothetical protein